MGMGLATMFVLICSNVVISSIKNLIPDMAVSYTHLLFPFVSVFLTRYLKKDLSNYHSSDDIPVSYTHLDVYKRQTHER